MYRFKIITVCGLVFLFGCKRIDRQNNLTTEKCTFNASYNSIEEAESKLIDVLKSKYGSPDSISTSFRFYGELVDFILKEPKTIEYKFDRLQNEGYAEVVTSEDGNLRLYYWDNESSWSRISWCNVCQYRGKDKVYAYEGSIKDIKYEQYESSDESYSSNCAILGIKTIYDNTNSPVYLVYTYIRESGNWGYNAIEAIKIDENRLVAVPIFRDEHDPYGIDEIEACYRGVEYTISDWYFRANKGEGWKWMFRFDDSANILYVHQADPEITDRYSLYRYNGEVLYCIGTDGGFWLHPTIRSFEFLVSLFETEDYRIRIDRMYDGSYRYASWNNHGSMDKMPDIILYDGISDDQSEFIFFNKGYEYVVNRQGLIVKHNGKTVLSQSPIR